ncbi:hypothetical protein V6C53_04985 [Desulfocurvibacter africanus]|uniref:hypothetical protein n=1 Tax=Desulfocurvibacter africanus TaxID=873 RepID=UPI002FDAC7F2
MYIRIFILSLTLLSAACGSDGFKGITPEQAVERIRSASSRISQADVTFMSEGIHADVYYDAKGDWPADQVIFMETNELLKAAKDIAGREGADNFSDLTWFLRLPSTNGGSDTALKLRYARAQMPAVAKAMTNWELLNLAYDAQATGFGRPLVQAFCSDPGNLQNARPFCSRVQ